MKDNEYAEYIDNEQLCRLEGVPCKCGIPCCNECFTPSHTSTGMSNRLDIHRSSSKEQCIILN